MIHYHGLPITPATCAEVAIRAGHAFVSFAHPAQLGVAVSGCQSFAVDNGAFSAWKKGEPMKAGALRRCPAAVGLRRIMPRRSTISCRAKWRWTCRHEWLSADLGGGEVTKKGDGVFAVLVIFSLISAIGLGKTSGAIIFATLLAEDCFSRWLTLLEQESKRGDQ